MDQLFKIFKVDASEVAKISQQDNPPHQHTYEELIIGLKGCVTHFIDYKTETVRSPFVSFVTKGKIHRVQPGLVEGACDLWVLRFKSEFIPETTFSLYAFYHDQANLQYDQIQAIQRLDTICQLIDQEMQQPSPQMSVVQKLLSTLFIMIESDRTKSTEDPVIYKNQNTTFRTFLAILEDNYARPEGVSFYAEKLFMSARNLNLITQNILHQSVSEIIETRKLIAAKDLLITTDKPIAEIGYELGYTDKAYFTSVFRKKSGITPSEFREEMRHIIS